jgi:hypothetical protein
MYEEENKAKITNISNFKVAMTLKDTHTQKTLNDTNYIRFMGLIFEGNEI